MYPQAFVKIEQLSTSCEPCTEKDQRWGLSKPSYELSEINTKSTSSLLYGAHSLYLFTRGDLEGTVVFPYLFSVICAFSGPVLGMGTSVNLLELLSRTPAILFWCWTNLLLFNIHNQRHVDAIEEDSINKPWRPLPAQRMTASEAGVLMYAMYPVVFLSSAHIGGLGPCIMEAMLCVWYNEWRGHKNPLLKNFLFAAGISCFLAASLEIAIGGVSLVYFPKALLWLVILGLAIFMTCHTQDFRDQEGDRLTGRRSIPIAVGDGPARWIVVSGVAFWSCLSPAFWQLGVVGFLVPACSGAFLASFLMFGKTVKSDKMAWRLWPIWVTSLFCLPLLKMYG